MEAYTQYGEWSDSKGWSKSALVSLSPDYVTDVLRCGWCDSWKKHGLLDHGSLYCEYVDDSLVEGFNPENSIEIQSLLSKGDERCRFVWSGLSFDSEQSARDHAVAIQAMAERNIKDFLYHTAHLYSSIKATFSELLGEDKTEAIVAGALTDFEKLFGTEKKDMLLAAAERDFAIID